MAITDAERSLATKAKFKPKHSYSKIRMPNNVPLMNIEELIPYPNNAKIHTHQQIKKICTSIDTACQWTQPIIVDGDNVIIAGHGRRLSAIAYGFKKVPVIKLDGISDQDAKVLRLADNKVAEGEIDTLALEQEIRILSDFGIDMIGIFDEREFDFLTEDLGEIDISSLSDDVSKDVERQLEENEKISEDANSKESRLSDVFGKRPITPFETRTLGKFLSFL